MQSRKLFIVLIAASLFFVEKTDAQISDSDKIEISPVIPESSWILLKAKGAFQWNYGDWKDRYPYFTSIPIEVEYSHQNKWAIGANFAFTLGSQVVTDPLFKGMTNSDGYLLDLNGYPAVIRTYMRGYQSQLYLLKTHIIRSNRSSRWLIQYGGGVGHYLNYTKYVFDLNMVPLLEENNLGLFDQRAGGFTSIQKAQLSYLDNNSVSFYIGMEVFQGYGKSLRPYTMGVGQNQGTKTDGSFGLFGGIIIPINVSKQRVETTDYFLD